MSYQIRIWVLASLIFFGFSSLSWGEPAGPWTSLMAKADKQKVRVIVQFRDNDSFNQNLSTRQAQTRRSNKIESMQKEFLNSLAAQGLTPQNVKKFQYIPFVAMEADSALLNALQANPNVVGIEEDVIFRANLADSNPLVGGDILFNNGHTGSGQTIAILDTGVDKTHSFFGGRVVSEACYSSNNPFQSATSVCPGGVEVSTAPNSGLNCDALDPSINGCDHGTHVAGIAAGNGAGLNGMARDANIIAIQVFSKFTKVSDCSPQPSPCVLAFNSDIIQGGERVLTLSSTFNIASVNLSLGGNTFTSTCDFFFPSEKALIDNLRAQGIATVIASGNQGATNAISSPACISSAISVGSTNKSDVISSFSNTASFLSLLAPGQSINSSVPGNSFSIFSGTSMATPHVAGAWAAIKQAVLDSGNNASVTEILLALQTTGVPIPHPSNGFSFPRIQVDQAIDSLTTSNPQENFVVSLGGNAFDMELDSSRDLLYVSVPSLNEIVVISTLNYTIVDRIVVGSSPSGIDMSHDSRLLFIALNGGGGVAFLDLDTKEVTNVLVQGEVGDFRTYDVAEGKPNRVFVSANPSSSGFAWIGMINLDDGNSVTRVASNRIIRASPTFQKDPNEMFLYVGEQFSPNSLYKLDISLDTAPIILEDDHGAVNGTNHLAISPDGAKMYLRSGQVLNTDTFFQAGTVGGGVPALNKDGSSVFIGRNPNIVDVFNTSTFLKEDEINTQCPTTQFQRLMILPDNPGWIVLGNDTVCVRDVKPTSSAPAHNDFNSNNISDLLAYNTGTGEIGQLFIENAMIQTVSSPGTLAPATGWTIHATGDFNGDRKADLLAFNTNTDEVATILMDGPAVLSSNLILDLTGTGFTLRGTGDFDGDGQSDVLVFNPTTGLTGAVIINNGAAVSFAPITLLDPAGDWSLINSGDFDGNAFADLLIFNTVSNEIAAVLWDGAVASPGVVTTLGPDQVIAQTADFTGDNNFDLLTLNTTTGDTTMIALDGTLIMSETPAFPIDVAGNWSLINAGNYNSDTFADYLLVNNSTGDVRMVVLNNGEFVAQHDLFTLDLPTGWTLLGGKP